VGAEDQPVAELDRAHGQRLEQVRVLGHGGRLAQTGPAGRGRLRGSGVTPEPEGWTESLI